MEGPFDLCNLLDLANQDDCEEDDETTDDGWLLSNKKTPEIQSFQFIRATQMFSIFPFLQDRVTTVIVRFSFIFPL